MVAKSHNRNRRHQRPLKVPLDRLGGDDDGGTGRATMTGPKAGRKRQDPGPWYASRRPSTRRRTQKAISSAARQARPRGPDGRFLVSGSVVVTKDCTICAESREMSEFPDAQISELCLHPPGVCLTCIQTSIRVDFSSRRWNQIHCPECRALLDYHHVRKYADEDTFAKYEAMSLRAAVGEEADFAWCPTGCGSGQVHEAGRDRPIVTCVQCEHRFCFVHQVPWHEGFTCTDYDAFQQDPRNFKRQVDIDNEAIERRARKERWRRERQEEADRLYAQSLLDREQAEEARRFAEQEAARRRMQERAEWARRQREREVEEEKVQAMRAAAERRHSQEQKSLATINETTKPCPGCGWAIQKSSGCDHMTCSRCRFEFCYECGADYRRIVQYDNTQHRRNCIYYR